MESLREKGTRLTDVSITRLIWLAPILFVLHVLEEAPGFVSWANELLAYRITDQQFLLVNATALVVTVLLAVAVWRSKEGVVVLVALAWLSFMMFANAFLHITATLVYKSYVPGVVTSSLLYLPYFLWFVVVVVRKSVFRTEVIAGAIVLGAIPMLLHGYLLVFEGSRLF